MLPIASASSKIPRLPLVVDPTRPDFGHVNHPWKDTEKRTDQLVWTAQWTSDQGSTAIATSSDCLNTANPCTVSTSVSDGLLYDITWSNIFVVTGAPTVNVTFAAVVGTDTVSIVPSFGIEHCDGTCDVSLGLYQWGFELAGLPEREGLQLFTPASFGVLSQGLPSAGKTFNYPSGGASMQFMAAYYSWPQGDSAEQARGGGRESGPGVYLAAHDPLGEVKTLSYARGTSGTFALAVAATPPGAALAMRPSDVYTVAWPLVCSLFEGDWFDAAMIYRAWVLPNAVWTRDGPTSPPAWFQSVTTWVNSHWQQLDIFNVTGGDPAVVVPRVAAIMERFQMAPGEMALHWYEWDLLGYSSDTDEYYGPCPETAQFCGFDTNYPDYFPVRSGFGDAVAQLQDLGVPVVPYINGRIHDQNTDVWATMGFAGAGKGLNAATTLASASAEDVAAVGLGLYNESYGSHAVFSVMCPHEAGWQGTIASTVGRLVADYGVQGVYIDQIAASGPVLCFDPSHGHELGGGKFWVEGYRAMLDQARAAAAEGSTDPAAAQVLITESNAEPYMGKVDVLLTLTAFEADWSLSSVNRMAPAFPAIYGGYYSGAGAEFFQTDLTEDNGNVFCAKLAQQFLTGVQLGWISLGGRDNQDPAMGLFDLLMDPSQDASAAFVARLSRARASLGGLFFDGRGSRDLRLSVVGTLTRSAPHGRGGGRSARARSLPRHGGGGGEAATASSAAASAAAASAAAASAAAAPGPVGIEYDSVRGAVWVDSAADAGAGLTVLLVAVEEGEGPLAVSFALDAPAFGLGGVDCASSVAAVAVDLFDGSDGESLGTFGACDVALTLEIDHRSAAAVRVRAL